MKILHELQGILRGDHNLSLNERSAITCAIAVIQSHKDVNQLIGVRECQCEEKKDG